MVIVGFRILHGFLEIVQAPVKKVASFMGAPIIILRNLFNAHIEQVKLQLTRQPYPLPKMSLNPDITDINRFRYEDFVLSDYLAHPNIKGDISV